MEIVTREKISDAGDTMQHLRWSLAAVVACLYGGFLLASYSFGAKLAQPLIGSVPWSFMLGGGLLLSVVAIMSLYVAIANNSEVE